MEYMKKLTKAGIKRLIKKQGQIKVLTVPCKANPDSMWWGATPLIFNDIEDFEKFVNEFTHYSCNTYVGRYPSYYVKTYDIED